MKRILLLSISVVFFLQLEAQNVSINTTGDPAASSAMLDISSTDKGLLIPRMASFQRAMISNPAQGLLVYDTDTRSFWFYDGAWEEIASGNGPAGPAGGDLTDHYPSPTVAKIQNLDVAFGVPLDKQIMKWDALSNNWKGRNDSLFLPYNATYSHPDKLFSITNTSPMSNTAIYGRRLAGSGLGLSSSNGVWGDNLDGNGVAGTSATGVGVAGFADAGIGVAATSISGSAMQAISTTGIGTWSSSQTNFGLASTSNGTDKAGLLGVNTASGTGYGVIGLIENTASGSAVFGKNNASGGHAGLFTTGNTASIDHTLKATTVGNGAAGYFSTSGLGPAGYFVSTNFSNLNPSLFVSNASNGSGITVFQNEANTTHGIHVVGNGTGKSIYSTTEGGEAGYFANLNPDNIKTAFTATNIGAGKTAIFHKNNTSGSISEHQEPTVLIDNTSKGNALKILSLHTPSVSSAVDIKYNGEAYGVNIIADKRGLHAVSMDIAGTSILAENYEEGFVIKAYGNGSLKAAIHAENSHMFGRGVEAITTGSQSHAIKGTSTSSAAAIMGVNNGDSGSGIAGRTNAPSFGIGVLGETSSTSWGVPAHFISSCPDAQTNTLWLRDLSKGQTIRVQVENEENASEALYIRHDGTGKFASFHNDANEAFSITNTGNTMTKGTMTVKGNKGIVRSSTSTQMRTEIINAVWNPAGSETLSHQEFRDITVTFSTAFASAPAVYVANITQNGNASSMQTCILNVTTTGCTFRFVNPMNQDIAVFDSTWKLVALGAE